MTPEKLLQQWLQQRLPAEARDWLDESVQRLRAGASDADLFRLVSLVTRKIGKADLAPGADDVRAADAARPGWDSREWSLDQAARILLLLASGGDGETFSRRLDQLCATADVGELVAFYRGLPLYRDQPRHALRAAEGLRSNMKAVFEAVSHRNPYPSEQLAEAPWNQLVLKTLFIGSTLQHVVGLDRRANAELARMLCDYAHERWAAGRPVSPELWRCVGPFAAGPMLDDLKRVIEKGTPPERAAAALALSQSPDPEAAALLSGHAELQAGIAAGRTTWQSLAKMV